MSDLNAFPATDPGLPSITRRLFLRSAPMAAAPSLLLAPAALAAEPEGQIAQIFGEWMEQWRLADSVVSDDERKECFIKMDALSWKMAAIPSRSPEDFARKIAAATFFGDLHRGDSVWDVLTPELAALAGHPEEAFE